MANQIIALILCILEVTFGFFLLLSLIWSMVVFSRKSLWAHVYRTVIGRSREEKSDSDLQRYTETRITYKYSAQGAEYQSEFACSRYSRYSSITGIFGLQGADPAEQYQIGNQTRVYYLWSNPKKSMPKSPGLRFQNFMGAFFGAGFIVLCGALGKTIVQEMVS